VGRIRPFPRPPFGQGRVPKSMQRKEIYLATVSVAGQKVQINDKFQRIVVMIILHFDMCALRLFKK